MITTKKKKKLIVKIENEIEKTRLRQIKDRVTAKKREEMRDFAFRISREEFFFNFPSRM